MSARVAGRCPHVGCAPASAIGLPASVRDVLRSPGRPLDPPTQAVMESRFGHDFSRVLIHTDLRAQESAQALRSHAYTAGEDLVFGRGAYAPDDTAGRRRIAHELAHVVQQARTQVAPSRALTAEGDPSEQAASLAADRATSGAFAGEGLGTATARVARDPLPPKGDAAPATNVLQEFDVDSGKGHKPWDLDRLVKQIVAAFGPSPERYIEIVGYYDVSEENVAGAARDAALKRVDTVQRALLAWAPKIKGRLRVTTRDRDLWRESGGEPTRHQIGVEWGPFGTNASVVGLNPPPILPSPDGPAPKPSPVESPLPAGGGALPAPADVQAGPPYPGKGLDAFRAFLATPMGVQFKEVGKRELKHAWNETSVAEKVVILISQLLPLGIGTYALEALPANQKKTIVDLITSDADTNLLRPLPQKTTVSAGLDLDPDFAPKKLRTSVFDADLPSKTAPRAGQSALGVFLKIDKPAVKTFFKPEETIAVIYAVPDKGWQIEVASKDGAVVHKRTVEVSKDGRLTLLAPREPGSYTLRLLDNDGSEKRSIGFHVQ